jgi:hypothetical protein
MHSALLAPFLIVRIELTVYRPADFANTPRRMDFLRR